MNRCTQPWPALAVAEIAAVELATTCLVGVSDPLAARPRSGYGATAGAYDGLVQSPIGINAIETIFDLPLQIAALAAAKVVLITVLGPPGFGMIVCHLLPAFAERHSHP